MSSDALDVAKSIKDGNVGLLYSTILDIIETSRLSEWTLGSLRVLNVAAHHIGQFGFS